MKERYNDMKKNYTRAEIEFATLEVKDVITFSNLDVNVLGGEDEGSYSELFGGSQQ